MCHYWAIFPFVWYLDYFQFSKRLFFQFFIFTILIQIYNLKQQQEQ